MLQPIWNDVLFRFLNFFVLMIQQRKCRKKKQCHIWGERPLVGPSRSEGVHPHIHCHVCIYWARWLGRKEGRGRGEEVLCTRRSFLWWEWRIDGRMQAIVAGKDAKENPPRSNLTIAKASEASSTYIFRIKPTPPRAFLNVSHHIKGRTKTHTLFQEDRNRGGGGSK